MIDEYFIKASLDDNWRTVPAIKTLLKDWGESHILVNMLRKLVEADLIDYKTKDTTVPKRGRSFGKTYKIEFFRRKQLG